MKNENNIFQLKHYSYILRHSDMKEHSYIKKWSDSYVWVPCEVDDVEDRREGVISSVPVACDGGERVGAVLTANFYVHKRNSPVISKSCLSLSQLPSKNNCCLWVRFIESKLREVHKNTFQRFSPVRKAGLL